VHSRRCIPRYSLYPCRSSSVDSRSGVRQLTPPFRSILPKDIVMHAAGILGGFDLYAGGRVMAVMSFASLNPRTSARAPLTPLRRRRPLQQPARDPTPCAQRRRDRAGRQRRAGGRRARGLQDAPGLGQGEHQRQADPQETMVAELAVSSWAQRAVRAQRPLDPECERDSQRQHVHGQQRGDQSRRRGAECASPRRRAGRAQRAIERDAA
jgi:hypothetical protein